MDRVVACRIVDRVALIALIAVLLTAVVALGDRNREHELADTKECRE